MTVPRPTLTGILLLALLAVPVVGKAAEARVYRVGVGTPNREVQRTGARGAHPGR
jgi:hypothetical protein